MERYITYPKQFRSAQIPIQKDSCFMLMPFDSEFDYIYGEIKRHLNSKNHPCNRADEIFGSVPIMSNILKEILSSHFVIADLTGQNANVFYELGIAHSFKDPHNIILISQSADDIPFDIRHLNTIIYSPENIKYLTASIEKTIFSFKHYYYFYEALQKKSIISVIHDNSEGFIEIIQKGLGKNIEAISEILDGNAKKYSEDIIKSILDSLVGVMYSNAITLPKEQLKDIVRTIGAVLCECSSFRYSMTVVDHLLHEIKLENYNLGRDRILSLQTELSIVLVHNDTFFDKTISWIISYFSRSKSASVDLNRYSLEKFLLTSESEDVNRSIANSILNENQYIREHMADISGEKRLKFAIDPLLAQLKREENIYATSSIITALGKIGDDSSYSSIVDWHENNKKRILRTQHYFILKHVYRSLKRLGPKKKYTHKFKEKYSEHLGPLATY